MDSFYGMSNDRCIMSGAMGGGTVQDICHQIRKAVGNMRSPPLSIARYLGVPSSFQAVYPIR